jgi:hypothetical protein
MERTHRTALVLDRRAGYESFSDIEERYRRLLQSVNGTNIKVDIYEWTGGTLRRIPEGQVFSGPQLDPDTARAIELLEEEGFGSQAAALRKAAEANAPATPTSEFVTADDVEEVHLFARKLGYTMVLLAQPAGRP